MQKSGSNARKGSILADGSRPRERPESGNTSVIGQAARQGWAILPSETARANLELEWSGTDTSVRFWPLYWLTRPGGVLFASCSTAVMIWRQVAAPSSSPASASSLARAALSSSALSP
jgi:hypothetical protein